jgi:hypothetical protein
MRLLSLSSTVLAVLPVLFVLACGDTSVSTCGDAQLDASEACDEGASNGQPGHCSEDCATKPLLVSIRGDVLPFASEVEGARVAGATISVLEHPEVSVTSDAEGHFELDGLPAGTEVTLVFSHPDYHSLQSATIVLGPNGVDPFTLQPVSNGLFKALAAVIATPLHEDEDCIVATTVARIGGSLYVELRQGEPGATVALAPAVPAESGPIYFNEAVIPTPGQLATSKDGGAVFINVPPGSYTLQGAKAGHVFAPIKIECRAGMVVNAGPSIGVQADVAIPDYGGGRGYAEDAYSASSDALCEATASCVNAKAGATNYPAVTVASCKSMFKNTWAALDPACDAGASLREAGKTFFTCRASSCALTLGDDTACATEEQGWVAAIQAYGACYAGSHP